MQLVMAHRCDASQGTKYLLSLLPWKAKHLHRIDLHPQRISHDAIAKGGVVLSQQVLSVASCAALVVEATAAKVDRWACGAVHQTSARLEGILASGVGFAIGQGGQLRGDHPAEKSCSAAVGHSHNPTRNGDELN